MLACGSLDDQDAPPRTAAPKKPKQPFLKRGEGVKRRVEAFKHRKPSDVKSGGNSEQSLPDQFEQQQGASVRQAAGHRQHCPEWRNEEDACRHPYVDIEEQDAYTAEQQTRSNAVDRGAQGEAALAGTMLAAQVCLYVLMCPCGLPSGGIRCGVVEILCLVLSVSLLCRNCCRPV